MFSRKEKLAKSNLKKIQVYLEALTRKIQESQSDSQPIQWNSHAPNSVKRIPRLNKGGGRMCDFLVLAFFPSKKPEGNAGATTFLKRILSHYIF
jgi:hypothetical protein